MKPIPTLVTMTAVTTPPSTQSLTPKELWREKRRGQRTVRDGRSQRLAATTHRAMAATRTRVKALAHCLLRRRREKRDGRKSAECGDVIRMRNLLPTHLKKIVQALAPLFSFSWLGPKVERRLSASLEDKP